MDNILFRVLQMDIKSVIKTFAEAWAAASLRLDPGAGVSLPRPPHTWRPPSPAALGNIHIYSSLKNIRIK